MEVYEKINYILKQKNMTKRAFATILRNLEPKLKITGEIPSENTIYSYLSGRITMPIELITFIAEALNITEQELFTITKNTKQRCFKYCVNNSTKDELKNFNNFINSQINNIHINYGNIIVNQHSQNNKIDELNQLLKYAPDTFIDKILEKLKAYKVLSS